MAFFDSFSNPFENMNIFGARAPSYMGSLLDANELEKLIKTMRPSIMVIGEEYKDKKIIGKEYVGEIVFFPKMEGFSSTNIINKLYDR